MSICCVLVGAWMAAVTWQRPFADKLDSNQAAQVFTRSRARSDGLPRKVGVTRSERLWCRSPFADLSATRYFARSARLAETELQRR